MRDRWETDLKYFNVIMETPDTRKRAASEIDNAVAAATKRTRCQDRSSDLSVSCFNKDTPTKQSGEFSSAEAYFSVALDFVFRQVPAPPTSSMTTPTRQRRKTLLTRSEVRCLLDVTRLAHEIDVLVSMVTRASERERQSRHLRQEIESNANHPILRPVLSLLAIHGDFLVGKALNHVEAELKDRILPELELNAKALRQFSEQNLTLSESLMDAFGGEDCDDVEACSAPSSGQILAEEKRACGEIQEEIYARIEHFLEMARVANVNVHEELSVSTLESHAAGMRIAQPTSATQNKELNLGEKIRLVVCEKLGTHSSMAEFCNGLFVDNLSRRSTPVATSMLDNTAVEEDARLHSDASSPRDSPSLVDPVQERSSQVSPGSSHSPGSESSRASPNAVKLDQSSYFEPVVVGENTGDDSSPGPCHSPERNAGMPLSPMASGGVVCFASTPARTPQNASYDQNSQEQSPPPSTQSAVEALTVLAHGGANQTN